MTIKSNQLFSNNASTAVATQLLVLGTTLDVTATDGAKFQAPIAPEFELLTLVRLSDSSLEIVRCTARTADAFTIVRAQEGTTALQFEVGDIVEARITSASIKDAADGYWRDETNLNIVVGTSSATLGINGVELGNISTGGTATTNTVAVGQSITVNGNSATAVGASSTCALNSVAVGELAVASGSGSIAVGKSSVASSVDSIAIKGSASTADGCIAIGEGSTATGVSSVSLGEDSGSSTSKSVAIGFAANASGLESVVIGGNADAGGSQAIAIGDSADASATQSLAVGKSADAAGIEATAVGVFADAGGNQAIAMGDNTTASATGALAMGTGATVAATESTGIGIDATVDFANQINMSGLHTIKNGGTVGTFSGTQLKNLCGVEAVITSQRVDFTDGLTTTFTITFPTSGCDFYVSQCGVLMEDVGTVTGDPSVSIGVGGNTTKWVNAQALTSVASGRYDFTPASQVPESVSIVFTLSTAGTVSVGNMQGRFYAKGINISR